MWRITYRYSGSPDSGSPANRQRYDWSSSYSNPYFTLHSAHDSMRSYEFDMERGYVFRMTWV